MQSEKPEVGLEGPFAPRCLAYSGHKGDFRCPNERPIRLYQHRVGGWVDFVTLSTEGIEYSLRNFRVVGYSYPVKLLAPRTSAAGAAPRA